MVTGMFVSRPNRFIAKVRLAGGEEVTAHVKNTGRCRELLVPGCAVYLQDHAGAMGKRKLRYSLIAVDKVCGRGVVLINMDSQAPNRVTAEWLKAGGLGTKELLLRPEYKYGNSRFDFYLEADGRRAFMEVKGVTLEEDGIARFPDAPTERGVKHIRELISCLEDGCDAYIFFVIQMKGVRALEPNDRTHPAFGEALREAARKGVQVLAYDCVVRPDELKIDQRIEVWL